MEVREERARDPENSLRRAVKSSPLKEPRGTGEINDSAQKVGRQRGQRRREKGHSPCGSKDDDQTAATEGREEDTGVDGGRPVPRPGARAGCRRTAQHRPGRRAAGQRR